jgi:hypothetical protein
MDLPVFNDEAFFLWAGRQIRGNPLQNLFINFSDGKEPLFFWVYGLAPDLLTLRLLSVFFGFLTFIYFRKITNNFWASLFFILSPFLLFYQRIGMQESMLTFLLTAAMYYLVNHRFFLAGIFAGLSLLTKTTALALLIPLFFLKFNIITIIICFLFYLPVFILGSSVSVHNSSYIGLIPLSQIITNFKMAISWLWGYQGFWGVLGILTPPVVIESLIAKIFFPRYFLFIIPFLIILISKLPKLLLVLLIIPNIILSYQIISSVKTANLPYIEKWQYLEAWPAGYGIKETADFLITQSIRSVKTEDVMVVKYGLSYYYPELVIDNNSRVWVLKKSKELADERYWEKVYNSYDVSVYRARSGSQ